MEFSIWEIDVLDYDCPRTRVGDVDDDPLGFRHGSDVAHALAAEVDVRMSVPWSVLQVLGVGSDDGASPLRKLGLI